MKDDRSDPGQPWTPKEMNVLRVGFWDGRSDEQIAANLPGRTARSVEIKRHREGLLHRKEATWRPEEDKILLDLRSREEPYRAIAEVLGRSVTSCKVRYHRLQK